MYNKCIDNKLIINVLCVTIFFKKKKKKISLFLKNTNQNRNLNKDKQDSTKH